MAIYLKPLATAILISEKVEQSAKLSKKRLLHVVADQVIHFSFYFSKPIFYCNVYFDVILLS